jgi:hypothetical protein
VSAILPRAGLETVAAERTVNEVVAEVTAVEVTVAGTTSWSLKWPAAVCEKATLPFVSVVASA